AVEALADERPPAFPTEDVGHRSVDRPEDRGDRQQRANETEAQRERTTLHELPDEPRLLPGGRGQQAAYDLGELELGLLRAVQEAEDADDEREQRDQREEDLVRDGAGEKQAVVGEEGTEDPARGQEDAVSPFGATGAGASLFGVSVFAGAAGFVFPSVFPSVLASALPSVLLSEAASDFGSALSFCWGRLSVLYQPPPLKTIAGVAISFRGRLPQLGHLSSVASVYDWTAENVWPQWSQW